MSDERTTQEENNSNPALLWAQEQMAKEAKVKQREALKNKYLKDPEKGAMYQELWNKHGLKEACEKDETLLDSDTLFLSASGLATEKWKLTKAQEEKHQETQVTQSDTLPASQTIPSNVDGKEMVNLLDGRSTEELGKFLRAKGVKITDHEISLYRVANNWKKPNKRRRK